MEIQGTIKLIKDTQIVSEKFKKRELVITTEEQYPQTILVEFNQDKCDVLDKYYEGQNVKVFINIRGREWINLQGEVKYFNTIQGWKIEKLDGSVENTNVQGSNTFATAEDINEDDKDDLPF